MSRLTDLRLGRATLRTLLAWQRTAIVLRLIGAAPALRVVRLQ